MPYFLGQQTPPWPRAASVQKCVRTLDIDEVGKTTRHGTFFQMNGNFSFGDYFKEGAIALRLGAAHGAASRAALRLRPGEALGHRLPRRRRGRRRSGTSSPACPTSGIVRRGRKDNYWHMGVPGPGGPVLARSSSTAARSTARRAARRSTRTATWRSGTSSSCSTSSATVRSKEDFPIVGELPKKNIDTGMGLERIACAAAGRRQHLRDRRGLPGHRPGGRDDGQAYGQRQLRRVRAAPTTCGCGSSPTTCAPALMLIGDGVTPGNEGRGYVLRRLLRRAVRSMRLLGCRRRRRCPTCCRCQQGAMSASYPELGRDFERISQVAYAEEEAFRRTLAPGTTILDTAVARGEVRGPGTADARPGDAGVRAARHLRLPDRPHPGDGGRAGRAGRRGRVPPAHAASSATGPRPTPRAKKAGHVDTRVYRRHRRRARAEPVEFTGYDEVVSEGRRRGVCSSTASRSPARRARRRRRGRARPHPVLRRGAAASSPTRGAIDARGGAVIEVRDVQAPITGPVVHRATGGRRRGRRSASPAPRPRSTSTAAGRSRAPTRRRTWCTRRCARRSATPRPRRVRRTRRAGSGSTSAPQSAVPKSVLRDVEARSTRVLLDDLEVTAEVMTHRRGRAAGAMALFGEKYGDAVRVVVGRRLGRASSAAAPTRSAPASSASSSCSASPRSAPACGGSRRWWASTRTPSSPASTRSSAS